jgi:hypothetical protein
MDEPLVLVGFGEALAAPEVIWSLQRGGCRVACFARGRPVVRRIRGVELHQLTAPEQDLDRAAEELARLVERLRPDVVMPLDDASLYLSGAGEQLTLALDKRVQIEAARAAGFRPPATHVLEDAEQALGLDHFPLVLKPALAVQRDGNALVRGAIRFCADRRSLEAAVRDLRGPALAQEVLRGVGEGIVGVGERAFAAHRRIRMMNPAGSGSSACCSIPLDPDATAASERMLAAAGWRGLFMVELLREEGGGVRFMELNGRAWGSLALTRRIGLELPAAAARGTVPSLVDHSPIVCRHAGRELVHLLFVLRGPRSSGVPDWPARWTTVRDVLRVRRSDRWYNREPGYMTLLLEDTVRTVGRALR